MNERIRELAKQALKQPDTDNDGLTVFDNDELTKFAELMIAEFSDVVKSTAVELAEFYTRQGASEEEVLMRVNGALVVLGHIRERFKD